MRRVVRQTVVPVRHAVARQVRQRVRRQPHRRLAEPHLPRILVRQREAVNAPRMPPAPARLVREALHRLAAQPLARVRIEHERVIGRVVGPHDRVQRGDRVRHRDVPVAQIPGLLARPEQQPQVFHAVDDHPAPVAVVLALRVPRLDEAPVRVIARGQPVRRPQSTPARRLVPGQLIVRDQRQRVQEAQVVIVRLRPVQPRDEIRTLRTGRVQKHAVPGGGVGQPQLADPEAVHPVTVVAAFVSPIAAPDGRAIRAHPGNRAPDGVKHLGEGVRVAHDPSSPRHSARTRCAASLGRRSRVKMPL